MKEYYPGGTLAEPSEDLLKLTKSAPVHNIFAERTLGTTDSAIRRSPSASIAYDNDNEIDLFRHHNGNNTNIKVIFKQVTMLDKCNCI